MVAIGPEHPKEKIKEICVWVYQETPDGDAAATEMTTHTGEGHGPHFLQIDGERWLLPVKRISTARFQPGRAFAVALALIAERDGGKEEMVWWGQPVELQANDVQVAAAVEAVTIAATQRVDPQALAERTLGGDGSLAKPLRFNGTL